MKSLFTNLASLVGVISLLTLTACGGGSTGANISGLSDLPDASSMVSTSATTSLSRAATPRFATSGTPPLISELSSGGNIALDAFWGEDFIADLAADPNNVTNAKAQRFFGETSQNEGGEGACRMTEVVARSFETMLEAGTSFCYMKNMPAAVGDAAITPAFDGGASTIFDQGAANRIVAVDTVNDPFAEEEGFDQNIFIKIFGTDNIDSGIYKVDLWFCNAEDDTLQGYEQIEVNKTTGLYTQTSRHNDPNGGNSVTINAFLRASGSGFEFDPTKTRTAQVTHSFDDDNFGSGSFKGEVAITADNQIIAKQYSSNSFDPDGDGAHPEVTWRDKVYAIGNFTGSGVKNVRFTEGGFSGISEEVGADWDPHTFIGGVEYQLFDNDSESGMYFATPDSTLAQTAEDNADFSGDTFYTANLTPADFDTDTYDCTATVDYTVTMDFDSAAVDAVREECDGHRLSDGGGNFCESESVRNARNNVFEFFQNQ